MSDRSTRSVSARRFSPRSTLALLLPSRIFAFRTICLFPESRFTVIPRIAAAIPLSLFFGTQLSADAVSLAASLIGRPYAWGAEGPGSFDCSGLTQYVYGEHGVDLPRRAISQSRSGEPAGRRLQRGDLLFFSTDTRRSLVTHVGIYEGDGVMIDASQRHGRVRRDSLEDEYWIDRFMFARRVTDEREIDERVIDKVPRPRRGDGRKATVRVLERIADVLLRRPNR